jgi:tetratricopeptide (TPR) repeat protein
MSNRIRRFQATAGTTRWSSAASRVIAALLLAAAAAGCGGGGRAVSMDPWSETAAIPGASWIEKIRTAETSAVLAPGDPYWPHSLGMLYASVDSMGRAEGWWVKALAVDPTYPPALSRLTQAYYLDGHHKDAVLRLEAAKAICAQRKVPFPPELEADLALHYEALEETDKANALRMDMEARNVVPASVGAYLLLRGADFLAAREPAERAMVQHPGSAVHFNNFGITRLQAGDPVEARKAFLQARELDPALPGPLYNLALVEKFYFMNDEAAREWFDRYWTLSHDDPDYLRAEFAEAAEPPAPMAEEPGAAADTTGAAMEPEQEHDR